MPFGKVESLLMLHVCHHRWLTLVFSLSVMCRSVVGLVCWKKPGCLSGDHKICAVGGWWLYLHSQHQAGETCGCFRENYPGSGEEQKDRPFSVHAAVQRFCLVHLFVCMSRWAVRCERPQVILPPTGRPSLLSREKRTVTVYTWGEGFIMLFKASPTVLWLTGSLTSSWLVQTKSSRLALTHASQGWLT